MKNSIINSSYKKTITATIGTCPNRVSFSDISIVAGDIHDADLVVSLPASKLVFPVIIVNALCSLLDDNSRIEGVSTIWAQIIIKTNTGNEFPAICRIRTKNLFSSSGEDSNNAFLDVYFDPFNGSIPFVIVKYAGPVLYAYSCDPVVWQPISSPVFNSEEIACLRSILMGYSSDDISKSFYWSLSKTKRVRSAILKKLKCRNINQAIALIDIFCLYDLMPELGS